MGRVRGSSLVETIVAGIVFLSVFTAVLSLLPRLSAGVDEGGRIVSADSALMVSFEKYRAPEWPAGDYREDHPWGRVEITLTDRGELRLVEVRALTEAPRQRIELRQWVAR